MTDSCAAGADEGSARRRPRYSAPGSWGRAARVSRPEVSDWERLEPDASGAREFEPRADTQQQVGSGAGAWGEGGRGPGRVFLLPLLAPPGSGVPPPPPLPAGCPELSAPSSGGPILDAAQPLGAPPWPWPRSYGPRRLLPAPASCPRSFRSFPGRGSGCTLLGCSPSRR